ncbi:uracil-DNA glycosylase [Fuscibacter oryzae]|uniref:Uracil-DNA glycosylase n=1 Tax=Fuscibacter oryzae TaxID=2803939 RepID=A0A8J7MUD4_9RHOB|nr:uracil-DNA glycosylase [Fuscibacter oryzae]MBL4928598.1 uracil-DNA glycosylase [Fuscibacter oryzae]
MPDRPEPPASWADLPFFTSRWPALWDRLAANPDWQPPPKTIFRALSLTPRNKVRVVILGQDPYPTPGRATGLAFSFPPGQPPRDSLKNILAELATDTGQTKPDGDLTPWAEQGVLLLNTALTVPMGQANGHKGWGWQILAQEILAATAADGPRAFLLWGNPAQKLCAALPRANHLFVASAHPSPLSCYRGFFGSRPFSAVNRWLLDQGQTPINWAA